MTAETVPARLPSGTLPLIGGSGVVAHARTLLGLGYAVGDDVFTRVPDRAAP